MLSHRLAWVYLCLAMGWWLLGLVVMRWNVLLLTVTKDIDAGENVDDKEMNGDDDEDSEADDDDDDDDDDNESVSDTAREEIKSALGDAAVHSDVEVSSC